MTSSARRQTDCETAAAYLRELLERPGKYRAFWETRIARLGKSALNEAAIARVLAEHLWDVGERPDTDVELPRRLRDRVSRALDGSVLSAETLRWFIAAFKIDPRSAAHLQHLRTGAWRNDEWW